MPNRYLYRHSLLKWIVFAVMLSLFCQSARADYAVQVGVYIKRSYADELVNTLQNAGFPVEMQSSTRADGTVRIRIIVGPYPQRKSAVEALARLKAAGHDGFIRKYSGESAAARQPEMPQPIAVLPSPSAEKVPPPAAKKGAVATPPPGQPSAQPSGAGEPAVSPGAAPSASEDIFSLDEAGGGEPSSHFTGFFQSELAYAESSPEHLSKFRNTLELAAQGRFTANMAWKVSGRAAYDAVFDLTDYYPTAVRDDQQLETSLRETYMDISAGDWDFRLGRQHIIWGEMVGLFFADVVSAKDLREFVLPDFDLLRIPQWAVRSEYFKGDFHGEVVWIPYPSYDNIGVPGSEFYPYPAPPPSGYATSFAGEVKPAGALSDSGYGLRLSYLLAGWDVSGFFYSSMDSSPAFFRTVVSAPTPTFVYTPTHDRIRQYGMTVSKDLTTLVVKAEAVYTQDRWFEVTRLSDADGVVRQDLLDYILGIEYPLPRQSRLNLQFFQRWFSDHDPAMIPDSLESGASVYATTHLSDAVEAELLWIVGMNRGDWMARPKLEWTLSPNWRWVAGADFFNGASDGLFGRYANKDRLYTEVRFTF